MMKSEDKQISLTDPDARSMATSGKDTGIVGYNVQAAVDTKNHLIVAHEVTNVGTDRHQLSNIAEQARAEMGVERLDAVADRGYYASEEIRACEEAGITVTLPKPMTSNSKAAGRFGKQDFRYVAAEDAYVCPAGQRLAYSFTTEDRGLVLRATGIYGQAFLGPPQPLQSACPTGRHSLSQLHIARDTSCASSTAPARSRPRTLNLIGTKRWLRSRKM